MQDEILQALAALMDEQGGHYFVARHGYNCLEIARDNVGFVCEVTITDDRIWVGSRSKISLHDPELDAKFLQAIELEDR